jgi:thermostable 8-oxoguanine DNA glycosylase
MSDSKWNLKPVSKKPSRKLRHTVAGDDYSVIGDYEKDSQIFLSDYRYQPKLTLKLDNLAGKSFDQELLNEIILWKVNRYATINEELLNKIDSLKILKQGEHRKGERVLSELLKVKGVDIAMASTILRFRNPDVYQIIDRHAYRALYGAKYPLYAASPPYKKIALYFEYIDKLVEVSKQKQLEYKTLDRLLYVFDKQLNGKL